VSAILDTYCAEERTKLRNPSAFFMCYAKKVRPHSLCFQRSCRLVRGEVKTPLPMYCDLMVALDLMFVV
jgi:hypothetical protein